MSVIGIRKHEVAFYGLMNGLFYAWNAAFYGFMSTYFLACGMKASQLSILLDVYMAVCFAGALFWGRMCDRFYKSQNLYSVFYSRNDHSRFFLCLCRLESERRICSVSSDGHDAGFPGVFNSNRKSYKLL